MEILLPADMIRERVKTLAAQITADYRDLKPLTIVGVLDGSLIFLADLVRQLDFPHHISLVHASSYRGKTTKPGELVIESAKLADLRGRHVLLLDDILDTGQTLLRMKEDLLARGVLSLKTVVLLQKTGCQKIPCKPDYCCFQIPDVFVIGYGLDYNGEYRHLPDIMVLPSGTIS